MQCSAAAWGRDAIRFDSVRCVRRSLSAIVRPASEFDGHAGSIAPNCNALFASRIR